MKEHLNDLKEWCKPRGLEASITVLGCSNAERAIVVTKSKPFYIYHVYNDTNDNIQISKIKVTSFDETLQTYYIKGEPWMDYHSYGKKLFSKIKDAKQHALDLIHKQIDTLEKDHYDSIKTLKRSLLVFSICGEGDIEELIK